MGQLCWGMPWNLVACSSPPRPGPPDFGQLPQGFLRRASAEKSTIGVGVTVGFLMHCRLRSPRVGTAVTCFTGLVFYLFLQAFGRIITRIPLAVERRIKVRHGTALLGNALEPRRLLKSSPPGPARLSGSSQDSCVPPPLKKAYWRRRDSGFPISCTAGYDLCRVGTAVTCFSGLVFYVAVFYKLLAGSSLEYR